VVLIALGYNEGVLIACVFL